MSQNHPDQSLNQSQLSQETNLKDEASGKNDAIPDELLSLEELDNVSGGTNEEFSNLNNQAIAYHPVGRENPSEPGTTFPTPPRPEDSP